MTEPQLPTCHALRAAWDIHASRSWSNSDTDRKMRRLRRITSAMKTRFYPPNAVSEVKRMEATLERLVNHYWSTQDREELKAIAQELLELDELLDRRSIAVAYVAGVDADGALVIRRLEGQEA